MKRTINAIAILCIAAAGIVYSNEDAQTTISARPIQIVSCDDIPASLDFSVKPMGYDPGFKIYYLLEGENLVDIKDDSLVLDFIKTANGADISKHRNGKPTYEQGSFPKVSENGKHGVFSVEVGVNQFGAADKLSIKGAITILTGSQRTEEKVSLSTTDKQKKKAGPFSVAIASSGGESFMGFGPSYKNSIGISVAGPIDSIIEVKLLDNGNELQSSGTMSNNKTKTFYFAKPQNANITVDINYWTDLKEKKVSF